jgi:hypothetical protein
MEINFGNAPRVNIDSGAAIGRDVALGGEVKSENNVKGGLQNLKAASLDTLQKSEPVAHVPDSALSRDDELGKLVSTAFTLPAPSMPDFKP